MIKEATKNMIAAVLANDPDLENWEKKVIMDSMEQKPKRRDFVTRREAAEMLGVSIPTVSTYVDAGRLHVIRMSPRKHRYDRAEIERLMYEGSII